ncbi:type II toxin-antitoxin system PemK/MazF family toxin [Paenibacillus macerans]|uniref:type II toxin-antitoxin system PemK/MazF family toxin n=1 Tax=Paenibacillus macerans TaxID=44252 RepID=UPI002DBEC027|nr:type II toxin-antitoxin system PemK/MazF family toxin [Paenibacillus macerans]MEC0330622.1 type II toxin-antitoxin system PemK/MazF family toxin [Paenibacillus macerans]
MNHNRGDVYLVLYPFEDEEKEKLRPAIIFDTREQFSIVIKVSSHEERGEGDIPIIHWKEAGLDEPSVARCSHYIPLHHEKIGKFLGVLHNEDLMIFRNGNLKL